MNAHHVVRDELSKERPEDVMAVGRQDGIVRAEQIVRHCTHVGHCHGFANAINIVYSFSSTQKVAIATSEFGVCVVVAASVDLADVEAVRSVRGGG